MRSAVTCCLREVRMVPRERGRAGAGSPRCRLARCRDCRASGTRSRGRGHPAGPDLDSGDGAGRVLHADSPEQPPREVRKRLTLWRRSRSGESAQEAARRRRGHLERCHLARAEVRTERDSDSRRPSPCRPCGALGGNGQSGDGRTRDEHSRHSRGANPEMKALACHSRGCYSAGEQVHDVNLA